MKNSLRLALQSNFFNFDSKIYKQTDGVSLGSLVGSSLANAFLCFPEQILLNDWPNIFALFLSPDDLENFKTY